MNFYKDGIISIPNVTGDIVITATAVQSAAPYTNQIPLAQYPIGTTSGLMNDKRINSSLEFVDNTGYETYCATGYIPVTMGDVIRIKNCTFPPDSSDTMSRFIARLSDNTNKNLYYRGTVSSSIKDVMLDADGHLIQFTVNSESVQYIALCFRKIGLDENTIITKNQEIPA